MKHFNRSEILPGLALLVLLTVLSPLLALQGERYALEGMEYYQRGEYKNAIEQYLLADKSANGSVPNYHYWLGRLNIAVGDTTNAKLWLDKYLQSGEKQHSTQVQNYLDILSRQKKIFSQMDVKNMPKYIYSWNSDYGAILSPDQNYVYYTSLSPAKFEKENIWRAEKFDSGWGKPYLVESLSSDKNEALGSFSQDGKTAYLFGNFEKGKLDGDIYTSRFDGKKWAEPVNLSQVNSSQVDVHPAVYNDKWMFFSSSRNGGFGGMDIWVSEFRDGMWSLPVNLGPTINTSGNEQTPFMDYDGRTLFFASDTHPGLGGYDLFKAVKLSGDWTVWSLPENLGIPANSIRNDRAFFHSKDANTGFITTDRKADNFEKFVAINFTFTTPPSYLQKDPVTGDIISTDIIGDGIPGSGDQTDNVSVNIIPVKQEISDVTGRLVDEDGNPVQAEITFKTTIDGEEITRTVVPDSLGYYKIDLPHSASYSVVVNKEGYNLLNQEFKPVVGDNTLNLTLQKLAVKKVFVLENVQFEFDSSRLTNASLEILNNTVITLLNNPEIKIEISGHTCNIGTAEYNLGLSQRRAKAVYDYLVSKGVESSRMTYKGYGLTRPMVSNATLAGKIKNRRVEFKVVE